jgi:hypothetical protein
MYKYGVKKMIKSTKAEEKQKNPTHVNRIMHRNTNACMVRVKSLLLDGIFLAHITSTDRRMAHMIRSKLIIVD